MAIRGRPRKTAGEYEQELLEWQESDHTGKSWYHRVGRGKKLAENLAIATLAEQEEFHTVDRNILTKLRGAVREIFNVGGTVEMLRDAGENAHALYEYLMHNGGLTRLEIFENFTEIAQAITGYPAHDFRSGIKK